MKITVILSRILETTAVFAIVLLVNIQPFLATYNYMGKILNSFISRLF
jgi:hypothetical protein